MTLTLIANVGQLMESYGFLKWSDKDERGEK